MLLIGIPQLVSPSTKTLAQFLADYVVALGKQVILLENLSVMDINELNSLHFGSSLTKSIAIVWNGISGEVMGTSNSYSLCLSVWQA